MVGGHKTIRAGGRQQRSNLFEAIKILKGLGDLCEKLTLG